MLAPSGPPAAAPLRRGLGLLAQRYRIRPDPSLWQREGFLAGSDEVRTEALNRALGDREVRAILCARGGYGATRILAGLDASLLLDDPKPIVGFSDVTAIHAWAVSHRVGTIHGPVVTQLPSLPPEDVAHLFSLLEHPEGEGHLPASTVLTPGPGVTGPLVGGNLSLVAALAGTPWAVATDGAIFLVEEVAEAPYRLDRLLTQLMGQCGASRLAPAAVGVGALTGCRPSPPLLTDAFPGPGGGEPAQPTALAVIAERLRAPGRSMLAGLPFGHGQRNRAWPVGALAVLEPSRQEIRWLPG